jgi:Domain of unknown function (DUF4252)
MKRILISVAILFMVLSAYSQSNAIDELFDKYSDKEGFTTVSISSKMFSMFGSKDLKDSQNQDLNNLMNKLKSIRILSVEDSALNKTINFYSELSKKLDFSVYEELMVVKEGNNTTKFLVKENGSNISELLVITGGTGGNTLISIRGDLDLKSISGLSKTMGIQQLESLDKIDQKPAKK